MLVETECGAAFRKFSEPAKKVRKGMRVPPNRSVFRAMPGFLTPAMPLALSLLASADVIGPDIAELPRANGPIFRAWIATRPWLAPGPAAGASAPKIGAPAVLPPLSSRFGRRADPFHRSARMHYGIDIPGRAGTPVQAADGGVVRFAGRAGGYGNLVEIAHADGLTTRYGHLSRILVSAGTPVARGDTVALMGSTGRSTGNHLHFELRADGRALDPLPHFGQRQDDAPAPLAMATETHRSAFARAREARQPQERGSEP